jgi:hypothetical protein
MADISLYYNAYNVIGDWTNEPNAFDGNESTYAYAGAPGKFLEATGTNHDGSDLGTITKVEIRYLGYTGGGDGIEYGVGANQYVQVAPAAKGWTAYYDITSWYTWTWNLIQTHTMGFEYWKTGGAAEVDCYKIELLVTYSPSVRVPRPGVVVFQEPAIV